MPDRRRLLLSLAAAFGSLALGGCDVHLGAVEIASHVCPGSELMFLARDLGWQSSSGVRLVELPSTRDCMHALSAGLVDGAALTLPEVLSLREAGVDLSVVLVLDVGSGAGTLLVQPRIKNLAALSGQRIGYEPTATGRLLFHATLEHAGLSEAQVRGIPVDAYDHEEAWGAGQVDAFITQEPIATRLEQAGARRLPDRNAIPESVIDVLAVTPDALRRHDVGLRALVRSHLRALNYFEQFKSDANYRLTSRLRVAPDAVRRVYSGLRLPDLHENRRLMGNEAAPLMSAAQRLQGLMRDHELISGRDKLHGLLNAAMLPTGE